MNKRVEQPAAGGKSLEIQCATRKMRSFELNCLFYFCIDYFLHFLRGVQISLRGGVHPPSRWIRPMDPSEWIQWTQSPNLAW